MTLIKISALHINSQSRPFLTFFLGSFAVQNGDHLRSGIICGTIWGSFPVLVSFAVQFGDHLRFWDHLRSWDHLRTRTDLLEERSITIHFMSFTSFKLVYPKRQPRVVAACFTVTRFIKTPNKVYIFWKLRNCRFRLLVDLRQEIKTFPKIALIFQKYIVSQVEFVSGQNLTGNYVFFTP